MNDRYFSPETISVAISFSRSTHNEEVEAIIEIITNFEKRNRPYEVVVYYDRENNKIPLSNIDEKINKYFKQADIIICLVTGKFLQNEYVLLYEKTIIEEFAKPYNRKDLIPIIVSKARSYSWIGDLRKATLPTVEAFKKPYSYYTNKDDANLKIKNGLDERFKKFQEKVVLKRVPRRNRVRRPRLPKVYSSKAWKYILGSVILMFFLKFLSTIPGPLYPQPGDYEDQSDSPHNPQDDPPPFHPCNSIASMETVFPRDLSDYPYFGKELYGRYESCQGINKEGYKPCKKNRRWYIVNETRNQHLFLKLDRKTHEDIFAIRPLFNGIAEVYYHDGKNMYLSFCVSLKNGELIE